MDLASAFAGIGLAFSAQFGGPYWPARIITNTPAEYDRGGSIITPGGVEYRDCMAQVDAATDAMRSDVRFVETDQRIIVLAETLTGGIGTSERIEVLEGPFAGVWSIEAAGRDTAATGWELRGRRG